MLNHQSLCSEYTLQSQLAPTAGFNMATERLSAVLSQIAPASNPLDTMFVAHV